jgi:excisionase family DNA binding protein
MPLTDPIWTAHEVADFLRVSYATIYRLVRRGEGPPAFKVGKDWRFLKHRVLEWECGINEGLIKCINANPAVAGQRGDGERPLSQVQEPAAGDADSVDNRGALGLPELLSRVTVKSASRSNRKNQVQPTVRGEEYRISRYPTVADLVELLRQLDDLPIAYVDIEFPREGLIRVRKLGGKFGIENGRIRSL